MYYIASIGLEGSNVDNNTNNLEHLSSTAVEDRSRIIVVEDSTTYVADVPTVIQEILHILVWVRR